MKLGCCGPAWCSSKGCPGFFEDVSVHQVTSRRSVLTIDTRKMRDAVMYQPVRLGRGRKARRQSGEAERKKMGKAVGRWRDPRG